MPVTLQPAERDALWEHIVGNFSIFSDLELAIHRGDVETCSKLGRKVSDGLRLILDGGLGWQERTATATTLRLPDSELRSLMARVREEAVAMHQSRDAEEARALTNELAAVRGAADSALEQIRARE